MTGLLFGLLATAFIGWRLAYLERVYPTRKQRVGTVSHLRRHHNRSES